MTNLRREFTCSVLVMVLAAAAPHAETTPHHGVPVALPGTIDAEDFDNGGEGIAYHDDSPGNSGGAYRATDVDLEPTSDPGGGHNVGWASPGEWSIYTVNVTTTGAYTVEFRVASPGAGGTFHLEANGVDVWGDRCRIPEAGRAGPP